MKQSGHFFFLSLIIFACSFFAAAQDQEKKPNKSKDKSSWISTKYDKSKNLTTVRLKKFTITKIGQEKAIANNIPLHQMDLEVSFSYAGEKITNKIEDIEWRFHTVAGNYIFLKGQPVIFVLNKDVKGQDRALGVGTTDYKSSAPKFNSVYEEFLPIKVPSNVLAKIVGAQTLEIYVGPVSYQLTPEQHDAIREIALILSATPPSQVGN